MCVRVCARACMYGWMRLCTWWQILKVNFSSPTKISISCLKTALIGSWLWHHLGIQMSTVSMNQMRAHTHTHTVGQRVQESTKTAHLHCSLMVKMFRCGEFKKMDMWTRLKTLFSFQGDFNLICKENVISEDRVPLVDLIIHASVKTIKIQIIYLLLDFCASVTKFPSCLHHFFNSPGILKNLGFSNAYKHTHGSTCDGGYWLHFHYN